MKSTTPTPSAGWLSGTPAGRRVLFGVLYFSEGAPIGFIWWYLPTMLRAEGVPVDHITTLIALVAWPWVLKFIWAPLIDIARHGKFSLRVWVLIAQLFMGLSLLPLIGLDLAGAPFGVLVGLLLCHAVSAATQDVAIDAWAISITPPQERGTLSGFMQAGMLGARWVFGAGLLLATSYVWPRFAILVLIATVWGCSLLVLFAPPPEAPPTVRDAPWRAFGQNIAGIARRRVTWLAGLLALVGGLAYEAVGAVTGPFLIDRGLSKSQVGWVMTATAAAMLLGGLAGGWLVDRLGRAVVVSGMIVLIALDVLALGLVDRSSIHELTMRVVLLILMYAGIGAFVAASYALFMDVTDPRLGGTQFSTFMGLTNACESIAAFSVGKLIASSGYSAAFIIMALVSVPAALLPGFIARQKS